MTDLAASSFVSLTTYRRSGDAVPTTVWVARDEDALIVTTPVDSGKVKRLRRDPRVTLRRSSRFGRVDEDAPEVGGTARILDDPADVRRSHRILGRKYGVQYRLMMAIEKLLSRKSRERVILSITPA